MNSAAALAQKGYEKVFESYSITKGYITWFEHKKTKKIIVVKGKK